MEKKYLDYDKSDCTLDCDKVGMISLEKVFNMKLSNVPKCIRISDFKSEKGDLECRMKKLEQNCIAFCFTEHQKAQGWYGSMGLSVFMDIKLSVLHQLSKKRENVVITMFEHDEEENCYTLGFDILTIAENKRMKSAVAELDESFSELIGMWGAALDPIDDMIKQTIETFNEFSEEMS